MTHKQGRELKEFNRLYKEIDEVYHFRQRIYDSVHPC